MLRLAPRTYELVARAGGFWVSRTNTGTGYYLILHDCGVGFTLGVLHRCRLKSILAIVIYRNLTATAGLTS